MGCCCPLPRGSLPNPGPEGMHRNTALCAIPGGPCSICTRVGTLRSAAAMGGSRMPECLETQAPKYQALLHLWTLRLGAHSPGCGCSHEFAWWVLGGPEIRAQTPPVTRHMAHAGPHSGLHPKGSAQSSPTHVTSLPSLIPGPELLPLVWLGDGGTGAVPQGLLSPSMQGWDSIPGWEQGHEIPSSAGGGTAPGEARQDGSSPGGCLFLPPCIARGNAPGPSQKEQSPGKEKSYLPLMDGMTDGLCRGAEGRGRGRGSGREERGRAGRGGQGRRGRRQGAAGLAPRRRQPELCALPGPAGPAHPAELSPPHPHPHPHPPAAAAAPGDRHRQHRGVTDLGFWGGADPCHSPAVRFGVSCPKREGPAGGWGERWRRGGTETQLLGCGAGRCFWGSQRVQAAAGIAPSAHRDAAERTGGS